MTKEELEKLIGKMTPQERSEFFEGNAIYHRGHGGTRRNAVGFWWGLGGSFNHE